MRIRCPFCGERDMSEFAYLGDAEFRHPEPGTPDVLARYVEAVYLRDNPAGPHDELWFHTGGCRSWLRVTRDTLTHDVLDVQFARGEPPPSKARPQMGAHGNAPQADRDAN